MKIHFRLVQNNIIDLDTADYLAKTTKSLITITYLGDKKKAIYILGKRLI